MTAIVHVENSNENFNARTLDAINLSYSINQSNDFHVISFSSTFSHVIERIDQTEFEGFEYVNPLLMSLEDCV